MHESSGGRLKKNKIQQSKHFTFSSSSSVLPSFWSCSWIQYFLLKILSTQNLPHFFKAKGHLRRPPSRSKEPVLVHPPPWPCCRGSLKLLAVCSLSSPRDCSLSPPAFSYPVPHSSPQLLTSLRGKCHFWQLSHNRALPFLPPCPFTSKCCQCATQSQWLLFSPNSTLGPLQSVFVPFTVCFAVMSCHPWKFCDRCLLIPLSFRS